nr:hypothetical protein [Mangrovicoccus ximenensis]
MAERVLFIGGPAAAAQAEEQQALIAGIDHRMHRLGQHRGAAGDERGRELGNRDGKVGHDGADDRDGAFAA